MPHFTPDNILVVTYEELVPRFFKNDSVLWAKLSRDIKRGYGLKKVKAGKGQGNHALINFDSLPTHIKMQLDDPRKGQHVLERFFCIDKEAIEFYQDWRFADGSSIDDDIQPVYVANASVLNALLKLKEHRINFILSQNKKVKNLWQTLTEDMISFKEVLKKKHDYECSLKDNYRRIQEKAERYKKVGHEYLISGKHLNSNRKKVDDETIKIFESIFAGQTYKPNFTEAATAYDSFISGYTEIINNATGELYNPKDFQKLCKATVYNYLSAWDSKVGTYAKRSGDRQVLMSQFKPYRSFDKPKFAGSIISIDDRQPPFEYSKGHRVWFYLGVDAMSECYINWVYGKTKEGIITEFYRQMVRNFSEWGFNLPAELEAESSLNSSFKDTFLEENSMFEFVRIEANNARGKIIERYHGMTRYGSEKEKEGWIARPFARSEANQKGSTKVPFIPYENIISGCLSDIQNWNNSPHSIFKDKTRWEVFCEMQHPDLKPTNYRSFIPHLGYKTKTSCNAGIVKLQGGEYLLGDKGEIYTGESLINLMRMVEGEQIDVYWLDDNDGKIIKAYAYIGTKYMCEILTKPHFQRARIEQTENDIEASIIMSKYVASIEGYQRTRRKAIDKVTVINQQELILNDKFKVRELAQSAIKSEISESTEVEVLEDYNEVEMVFNEFETPVKSTLKDRF